MITFVVIRRLDMAGNKMCEYDILVIDSGNNLDPVEGVRVIKQRDDFTLESGCRDTTENYWGRVNGNSGIAAFRKKCFRGKTIHEFSMAGTVSGAGSAVAVSV